MKKIKCDFCKKKPKAKIVIFKSKKLQVCTICKAILFYENKRSGCEADGKERAPHGFTE
jgi:hypothetical protein